MLARRNLLAAAPLTALGIALTTIPAQQDSLDAPLDPVNANRYAYAGGDPVNNFDPTGLYGIEEVLLQSWGSRKSDVK